MENEVDTFEDMALFQESIVSIERIESLSIMRIFKWLADLPRDGRRSGAFPLL